MTPKKARRKCSFIRGFSIHAEDRDALFCITVSNFVNDLRQYSKTARYAECSYFALNELTGMLTVAILLLSLVIVGVVSDISSCSALAFCTFHVRSRFKYV